MTFTSLQKDYLGGGLAAALPAAATLGPTIPPGSCAFYFATDTNVLYRLAGGDAAWQVAAGGGGGGGGLVLLEQHTAAGSASLDFTGSISATYDEYMLELVDLQPAVNSANLLMRMSTNGGASYDAGANYGYFAGGRNRFGFSGTAADSGATSITLNGSVIANTATTALAGTLRLLKPLDTTLYKRIRGISGYTAGATPEVVDFTGEYQSTTAVNAFQFLFDNGNIAAGTVRCYGLAK